MQRILRTLLVGVLVLVMMIPPAGAWHCYGGGYGGGCVGCTHDEPCIHDDILLS